MENYLREFKGLFSSRLYCGILLLIGVCTYGFVITNYSIGIDDTAIFLYFDDGLAPYMGRWTLYVINKLIPLTQLSAFFIELISMIIMLCSATAWCVLFKEICDEVVNFPVWMYAIFAGVFITCPLISEVYVYYLHNGICIAYGLVAVALYAFLMVLRRGATKKECIRALMVSAILLAVALGCYESMILVYIMSAILVFILAKCIDTNKRVSKNMRGGGVFYWLIVGCSIVLISMLIRSGIINLLNGLNDWENMFARLDSEQRLSIFGGIGMSRDEIIMNVKYYFIKYFINAISYFPIRMLVISYGILGCLTLIFSIMKRNLWVLICAIALPLLPVSMCLVDSNAILYRAAQYVPIVITFTVLFLTILIWRIKWKMHWFRGGFAILLSGLIWTQCSEMNQWFTVDYMRYEKEKEIMVQVAKDLQATCDITKPIVFCGSVDISTAITETSELSFSDARFPYSRLMFDKFLPGMTGKQYCPQGYGYHFRETIFNSTINWGMVAFDGTPTQLIQFFKMHGYNFNGETDLEKIKIARELCRELEMPEYPEDGYIIECEEYIIKNRVILLS